MRAIVGSMLLTIGMLAMMGAAEPADAQSVTTYHNSASRSGRYIFPGLTFAAAAGMHLDANFAGQVSGNIYAQPLYWHGNDKDVIIVATESNNVYALDAISGKVVWQKSLPPPVGSGILPCGNILPLGITGTPVIDSAGQAVYFDAMVADNSNGPQHYLFGLSLTDGGVLSGYPINIADALKTAGQTFDPKVQNQRSALLLVNGNLFVNYSGHFGDCGDYRGWVVGVNLKTPATVWSWHTRAHGGGIWAPGGMSYDGESMYAATGNTFGASTWSDGEAIFRFDANLARKSSPHDYFAPADWHSLDRADLDLGGSGPLPIDVTDEKGTAKFVLALGKDGKAYLLKRGDLGGVGGAAASEPVSRDQIRTAPAFWRDGNSVMVAFQGRPRGCRNVSGAGLTVLRVQAHPARLAIAWCAPLEGHGAPIVTTLADGSNPIVWITGAEGDNLLHGFRGDTGAEIFNGGGFELLGLRHFGTILAANGRLYIAGDGRIYAFLP